MERAAADVRVDHSPTRCPYCHDLVAPEAAFVACAGCLAKHHAGCWRELGRCGSCGEDRPLVPATEAPVASAPRPRRAPDAPAPLSVLGRGVALVAVLLLAAAVGYFGWSIQRAADEAQARARQEERAARARAQHEAEEKEAARARAEAAAKELQEAKARAEADARTRPLRTVPRLAPATPVPVGERDHLWLAKASVVSAVGADPAAFSLSWRAAPTLPSWEHARETERVLVLEDGKSRRPLEALVPDVGPRAVGLGRGDLAIVALPNDRLVRFGLSKHAEIDAFWGSKRPLALALLPDSHVIQGQENGQTVVSWGGGGSTSILEIRSQRREVVAVAAAQDGSRYATASLDGTVQLWRPRLDLCDATLVADAPSPTALAFLPDGQSLAVAYGDATLSVWDAASARETRVLAERRGLRVVSLAALPDGDTLVLGCDDRTIRTFSIAKAAELDRIALAPALGPPLALAALPDGTLRVATRSGLFLGLELVSRDAYDKK